jgi:anti-anti-sigma factor
LRVLVGAQQLFGDDGGTVRLSHPSAPVMRLLAITGLSDFFSIDEPRTR